MIWLEFLFRHFYKSFCEFGQNFSVALTNPVKTKTTDMMFKEIM